MKRKIKYLFIVLCIIMVSSCKIQVESKILLSSFQSSDTATTKLILKPVSDECDVTNGTFQFTGNGCLVGKEVSVEIPVAKHPDIDELLNARMGLFYGKNKTLIAFIRSDTLNEIRDKLLIENKETVIKVRFVLVNDTKYEARVGVSNVWVNTELALGKEEREFIMRSGERVNIDLSDTSVKSTVTNGFEPVLSISLD